MKRERVEKLQAEFADAYCYGCPFFRHDAFNDMMLCIRGEYRVKCEVLDECEED